MASIDRAKAIKMFWAICKEKGWDDFKSHEYIKSQGFKSLSLSEKNAKQLSILLKGLGVKNSFVMEDKMTYKIMKLIEGTEMSWEDVTALAARHLSKNVDVEEGTNAQSIYHLPHRKKWKLYEIVKDILDKRKLHEQMK